MTDEKPACKDFRAPLLAVLAALTGGNANVAVEMTSTFAPVCERLGIAEDKFGYSSHGTLWTHRQIALSMRALRRAQFTDSKRKGLWEITELGLRAVKEGLASISDEPDSEEGDEDDFALAPVIRLPTVRTQYDEDAYLRALAVQQTPCYGGYHSTNESCARCLLATSCQDALDARLAEIAAELDLEDAKLRAAALAATKRKGDSTQTSSIDELLQLDTPTAVPPRAVARHITSVRSPREQVCAGCKAKIAKGESVNWIPAEGVFHEQCTPKESS